MVLIGRIVKQVSLDRESQDADRSTEKDDSGTQPSESRRQMDLPSVEEALEVAMRCAKLEGENLGDWVDNTWATVVKLRPLLSLAAQPEIVPPARFQQIMETCMACLLHAGQGHLAQPLRMLKLLDSADAGPLLRYLTWLEEALKKFTSSSSSSCGRSCRTVLVPQRVRSALCSWPAERSLFQQSAAALWGAIATHGPEQLRNYKAWRKVLKDREEIQFHQSEDCQRVAQEMVALSNFFAGQVADNEGEEWPQLARVTQESLCRIQQFSADMLDDKQESWSQALEDYEALGSEASSYHASMVEVARQVKRHEQAFSQAAQRFTEVANQLVAWTSGLVPKLRLLEGKLPELRSAMELRQKLPSLHREHLQAEDELDTAQTELRKHKRHSQASALRPRASITSDATTAAYVLERQCELRIANAQKRVNSLLEQLKDTENEMKNAEAMLPLKLDDDAEESGDGSKADGSEVDPLQGNLLSNEERLALKLATLQQFHEDMVAEVSQTQAERDKILRKVEQRKVQAALRRRLEPDFMCPILHERMKCPVLAADGFTYERQAIEKWLAMHNTSPMTGAVLAHRFLTENFALRHLIDAYETQAAPFLWNKGKSAKKKQEQCEKEDHAEDAADLEGEDQEEEPAEEDEEVEFSQDSNDWEEDSHR
eukprot:TRINITY_DN2376_c0_g1_i1.p1 TRINITY_DN2376_c0_g1~~TRINITY_DN2376_c0_g1_i1.p1  ORF type:complete len:657 (+),score=154.20 TRINITY_DN2376_c0_g1_i1:154-2124(+)